MKKSALFFITFILSIHLFSQITIDQSDMPQVGDTLRVSLTNQVPAGYSKTAMDTVWNYAALEALSQRVDTFVSASATPAGYQLFFVILGGATLAAPRNGSPVPGLPVSHGYTFFKNNSGSFSDLGSAYTVQGLPLPAKYDVPDKLYQFPLTPGSTWSSVSSFSISIPGLASYSTNRIRSNVTDGWGTLVTPYGTFQTVRVKSALQIHDSIYIDSLGTGFPFNRYITEYKWLAKGKGIPVLHVSEEGNLVTAIYRDIYRMPAQLLSVSLGPDTAVLQGTVLTLHASVAGGTPPYQILWNTLDTGAAITVTVEDIQTYSVLVVDALQNFGSDQKIVSIRYPPGIGELANMNVKVVPNPSSGQTRFSVPGMTDSGLMQVINARGELVDVHRIYPANGNVCYDNQALADGIYLIRIFTNEGVYMARMQVVR